MKIKHTDLEIPEEEPFKNCKLGREQYASVLTDVVETYKDGFVLSLNNPWGTGKTTFIKMWEAYLRAAEFRTIYFNAWENDFDKNPLVALMAELKALSCSDEGSYQPLLDKAAVLAKNVLPALGKSIAGKYIDSELFLNLIADTSKGATEILHEEIKSYGKKKKGLVEFREELESYVKGNNNGKPLILIIDELDRCRPNYAVEVLEQIKHFFNVPGIVFILSIDKKQLANAIKGVYGSEQLDSDEYLRRFIDLEFVIPAPEEGKFTKYLYDYYGFSKFFDAEERRRYNVFKHDSEAFIKFATLLLDGSNTTLRQQQKIFSHARIVLNAFYENNYLFPELFLFLVYARDFHPAFYQQLTERRSTPQEILNGLSEIIPKNASKEKSRGFLILEVNLMMCYNTYYREIDYSSEIVEYKDGEPTLMIEPLIGKTSHGQDFLSIYRYYKESRRDDVNLNHFLSKISLTSNFVSG